MIRMLKLAAAIGALSAVVAAITPANATTYTYVGSWEVDQGPDWPSVPTAYTGIAAAELLFGAAPAGDQYVTSTVDDLAADINFSAWVSTWGGACSGAFPCGTINPDSFVVSTGGLYENPGDQSSYVNDWAVGSQYTNYAFVATGTPEASTWAMMALGFVGLGFAGFRASRKNAAFAA